MSDFMTDGLHIKKKKKKTADDTYSEDVSFSEHNELEGSEKKKKKKKKNKHRSIDDDTIVEVSSSDNLSPSYNQSSFVLHEELRDPSEQELSTEGYHSNTWKSPKKSKKKRIKESSEDRIEETDHADQTSLYDEHTHSGEAHLSQSIKKKKKKHRLLEEGILENLQQNSPVPGEESFGNVTGCTTDDNMGTISKIKRSVKRKKSTSWDPDVTEDLTILDEDQMETTLDKETSDPKKKKKDGIFVRHEEQGDSSEQALSTQEYNSCTFKSSKKSKKKKRIKEPSEERQEETDHADQTVLYDEHTRFDETHFSPSVKKKKHRFPEASSLEEDISISEDIQQNSPLITSNVNRDVESIPSKRKETASEQMSSRKVDTWANSTIIDEREPKTFGCLSPIVRRSRRVTVSEDLSFNKTTGLESVDLARDEASLNVTEATGRETSVGKTVTRLKTKSPIKHKASKESHADQDVTEEFENLSEHQMNTSLDTKTSDPKKKQKKKSDGPQKSGQSISRTDVLSFIPKKDIALLEEYFPGLRSKSERAIRALILELERIREAKRNGIKFETGRFSSVEDELIKKNVEVFRKLVGLESGEMLFHSYRYPNEKSIIEALKKEYHFRQRIAQGLARTIPEVFSRGVKLYDLSGNKGRYTKEEVKKLQKVISQHGNDWITIGTLVGRSCKNVQLKASQLRREVTGGKWSIEEVNRLIQAVKELILKDKKKKTVSKEMLFTGISWAEIEKKVQTRNWAHCKSKWNDLLLMRMNNGISPCSGGLNKHTTIAIINWLHEAKLQKGQVNWLEMAKAVGNIPPGILQQKVYRLKSRCVPNWQDLSFKEIVDYLYTDVLPKVEASLLTKNMSEDQEDMPENKDKFLVSEIFEEYFGDDKKNKSSGIVLDDDRDVDSSSS